MKNSLILISLIVFSILLFGCNKEVQNESLSYDYSLFAKQSENESLELLDNAVYNKGDTVFLVMTNVKGFEKGGDGLNWFDVNVEIIKDDNVIIKDEDLLEDKGHLDLENNTAKSPYGTFTSDENLVSGIYQLKMTVKDKVSGKEVTATKEFELI